MKINDTRNAVLVFDLDDTLYPEYDYKVSGIQSVIQTIAALYPEYDLHSLKSAVDYKDKDWLDVICTQCRLNDSEKQTLLWQYRLHKPVIQPYMDYKSLKDITQNFAATALITDGRSITQRLKLAALGITDLFADILISESFQSEKPHPERFVYLQNKYGKNHQFIYVGDNIKKDFVTPKAMGWLTIGLKGSEHNIHQHESGDFDVAYHPHLWIESLTDLRKHFGI